MDKQQLLNELEAEELQALNDLSDSACRLHIYNWFGENAGTDFAHTSRPELIADYMEDYMRWQNDKSINELLEQLN